MRKGWVVLAVLGLAGCGLHTKTVHLQLPTPERVADQLRPIVIDSVTDDRDFSTAPDGSSSRAMLPKLMPNGDVSSLIYGAGNKHGAFVSVLAGHGTVQETVKDLLSNVLLDRGYRTVTADQAAADTPHISAKVTEFWSFLPFSLGRALTWTQQMKAIISTDITVSTAGSTREFSVNGYGANIIQVYSEENVRETYAKAMEDYSASLRSKLFISL